MSVDDFGIEVLKKAAEEIVAGDKSEYVLRFKGTAGPNATCATAAISRETASASNVTLKAANTARIQLLLFNDADEACFVKYGATASSTSFTIKMPPSSHHFIDGPIYTGQVDGIWEGTPTGAMQVTEC